MPVFLHTLYQTSIHYIGGNGTTNVLQSIIHQKRSLSVSSHCPFKWFGYCHYWCLLDYEMSFAPFVASWMLRVASIMSHQSCRMYHVAYLVSHQPCRINHVAGTYDMCIHATHITGDILRFIRYKTFLTEKSLTLRKCRNHFNYHATYAEKEKEK